MIQKIGGQLTTNTLVFRALESLPTPSAIAKDRIVEVLYLLPHFIALWWPSIIIFIYSHRDILFILDA